MAFTISSLVWLILLIAFVVVEALTVSLVSIWFAAGAVAALIVSGFTSSWLVQFAVFAVVSAVALAATRPLVKKAHDRAPCAYQRGHQRRPQGTGSR